MPNLVHAKYGSDGNQVLDPNSSGNGNATSSSGSKVAVTIGAGARAIGSATLANTNAGTGVGRVIEGQHPALGKFVGVKLMYENWDTAAVMQINAAKVAACASHKGAVVASNWSDFVTFNGNTTATVPQATVGIGGAGMPHLIPGILISDFVAVESLDRVDVPGNARLLRVRTHVNDNSQVGWINYDKPNQFGNGLQWANGIVSSAVGNLTTAGVTLVDTALNYQNPVAVIFVYENMTVPTILVCGDSLSMGAGTANLIGWPGYVTVNNWKKANPISTMNFAESGQTLEDSHTILRMLVNAGYRPTYAAFFAYSPNSSNRDAAGMLKKWTMVLQTIDLLESKGIKPILMTSTGVETLPGDLPEIIKSNNRVKSLAGRCIVVDGASLIFDFQNNLFLPQYRSINYDAQNDKTHYNDAGHSIIGDLVDVTVKAS